MKGKTFKRSLSAVMTAAMVLSNVSGVTVFAETGETESEAVTLANSDMSFDIWGDDAGWTVSVG